MWASQSELGSLLSTSHHPIYIPSQFTLVKEIDIKKSKSLNINLVCWELIDLEGNVKKINICFCLQTYLHNYHIHNHDKQTLGYLILLLLSLQSKLVTVGFWYFYKVLAQKNILKLFMRKASVLRLYIETVAKCSKTIIITRNTSRENTPIWPSNVTSVVPRQEQNTHWGDTSDTATLCERGRYVGSVKNISIKKNSSRNTSVMFTADWSPSTVKFVSSSLPVWTISTCTGGHLTTDWRDWHRLCGWWRMINN